VRAVWRRWGGWAIAAGLLAAVAGLVWHLMSDTAAQRREAPQTALLSLPLPPPPPPPPPPPEPERRPDPEPEKPQKITEPDPTPEKPAEKPMDDKAPEPSRDLAADPVTIAGDAQAGNDAFGIQAGRGGGSTGGGGGGGLGAGSYARYVSSRLQQVLLRDARTRHLAFEDIRLDLWLDAAGKASRVELVQGSGTPRVDALVLSVLRELDALDERPPASLRYPMRVSMKGVRP
jgi:outer membrane biosynthesis protein TonB